MAAELSIQEIQSETLQIMKVIHKICIEQNLKYALFYGTLIGAVRHKGFIPWDDDLDIVMPRSDYEKLESYFIECEKELLPYKLFSYKTVQNYPYMINRICNTGFRMEAENEKDCGMGTFIDVYPLDGAGNGTDKTFNKKAWFYSSMYFSKSREHYVPVKGSAKTLVKKTAYFLSKIASYKSIRKRLEKLANKYPYSNSEFVTVVVWGNARYFYKKSFFDDLCLTKYEDAEFYIPKHYDEILRAQYGDYMRLPPEEERTGHHFYKIYKKEK